MRKLLIASFLIALIALVASYGIWTQQRPAAHYLSDLRIQLALDHGTDSGHGNLLGIQPELFPNDYQSPARLHRKLAAYLQQARELGLLNARSIVVLPEHIGTWLVLTGEKDEVYQAGDQREAMNWLMADNPLRLLAALGKVEGRDRLADARLRMKAADMAETYQALFGGLARDFGVTLVAGSIVLPEPRVEQGRLTTASGALYNVSLVFASDGQPLGQPQRKQHPSREERRAISGAAEQPPAVFETPAGRLGVLIGSDSWYPGNSQQLQAAGATLLAVPAYLPGTQRWEAPWRGLRHMPQPAQISLKAGELSLAEAWHRLSLVPGDAAHPGMSGMHVFLRGQFWNQRRSGQGFVSHAGQILAGPEHPAAGARLLNLWLP